MYSPNSFVITRIERRISMAWSEEAIRDRHNITANSYLSNINNLNRFKLRYPDFELENTQGHVFFTRPDLNIFEEGPGTISKQIINRYEFVDRLEFDIELFKFLKNGQGGSFINPISNYVENFDLSDEIIKTREESETTNDWKIMYGGRQNESLAANTITLNYRDDRNLTIYKLHYIWLEYIHLISLGIIKPMPHNRIKKILDYAASVYFFLTAEDGETIIFYSKYTGVFPMNKPSSALSWAKGSHRPPNYSIQYQYSFKKDMDPLAIKDFNNISGYVKGSGYTPVYDKSLGLMAKTWASNAFVEKVGRGYKLRYV